MPTGYTAGIEDGTITDLKDYAYECARAFMAFVHQRDSTSKTLTYPPSPNTSYYSKAYSKSVFDLIQWRDATEEDRYAEWSEYYRRGLAEAAEIKARNAAKHSLYQSMLAQVQAKDVPSRLAEFKRFMINEIEISDTYKDDDRYYNPLEYVEWCEHKEKRLERDVPYYRGEMEDEWSRYNDRCHYINLLKDTFGFELEDARG